MRFLLSFLACAALMHAADRPAMRDYIDSRAAHFGDISRQIWEWAEVGYKETRSSALLQNELRGAGFRVQSGVADMPTAFTATFGEGQPVIAILGEFDALRDFAGGFSRTTASGRGRCGSRLRSQSVRSRVGAGGDCRQGLAASQRKSGTIRFYGTPAEEGGGGKVYMTRAGLFDDVDAVLAWHPGSENRVTMNSSLANISGKFRFYGKPAHASAAPDQGRSSLDALMITNMSIEFLREHVPSTTRIHYIVTAGGAAPNIVPDFTEGYFYARHPDMPTLDGIWARILKCADAGALATETSLEVELVNSVYNLLPNAPLAKILDRNLRVVGGVKYTPEETQFGEALQKTFTEKRGVPLSRAAEIVEAEQGSVGGSTDVGDVSWVVPTAQFNTATYVPGTPGHSWQSAACAGSTIGRKGMIVAAKTLALSAADLFEDPAALAAARKEFDTRRAGHPYQSRIPAGQKPPLKYRDNPSAGGQ